MNSPRHSARWLWTAGLGFGLLLAAATVLLLLAPARRGESAPRATRPAASAAALAPEARSCAQAGCHPDVTAQWESSSHRHSGLDSPWYRASLDTARQGGAAAAAWCAGCHTPSPGPAAAAPAAASVSCAVCHPGLPADHGRKAKRRAKAAPMPAAVAACASCHRGTVDETVNGYRWLRLFDDHGAWTADNDSIPSGVRYPWQSPACLDCHMPRVASRDAGGENGKVRSHRFAAANTALPALRGDREQLLAAQELLRSAATVDLFAMTHGVEATGGPPKLAVSFVEEVYAPLDRLPATVRRGESNRFDAVIRARNLGHRLPGGKGDLGETWLEVKAVDDRGRVVFWSGRADEGSAVDPGAHFLRTVWADDQGRRVARQEPWKARALGYRQALEPGSSHVARFRVDVPRDAGSRITVTASLRHRAIDWDLHRQAFEKAGGELPRLPITTLAEDSVQVAVVDAGAALPDLSKPALDPAVDVERWNDYGAALSLQGDFRASRKAFEQVVALRPDSAEPLIDLSLSVQSLSAALELLERAVKLGPGLVRARLYYGLALQEATAYDRALEQLRAAAELMPEDIDIRRRLGALLQLKGDYAGAARELEKALALDPADAAVHLELRKAYRSQGNREAAERHLDLYERYKADPAAQAWKKAFLAANPDAAREQAGVHEHRSIPLEGLGAAPEAGR